MNLSFFFPERNLRQGGTSQVWDLLVLLGRKKSLHSRGRFRFHSFQPSFFSNHQLRFPGVGGFFWKDSDAWEELGPGRYRRKGAQNPRDFFGKKPGPRFALLAAPAPPDGRAPARTPRRAPAKPRPGGKKKVPVLSPGGKCLVESQRLSGGTFHDQILSRHPNLSRKNHPKAWGSGWCKRRMAEKNGESTPRVLERFPK